MNTTKSNITQQRVLTVPHLLRRNEHPFDKHMQTMDTSELPGWIAKQTLAAEVIEHEVTFALLGSGKPAAGVGMAGEVTVMMASRPHPLSNTTAILSSVICFNYYDAEGDRHRKEFTIPKLPTGITELTGWFDLLMSLEDYDDGMKDNVNFAGFTKEIHASFISRLNNANINPKYNQRFSQAIMLAQWGVQ